MAQISSMPTVRVTVRSPDVTTVDPETGATLQVPALGLISAYKEAAEVARNEAQTAAGESQDSATAAAASEASAATSEANAADSAATASDSEDAAVVSKTEAEAAQQYAEEWANAPEGALISTEAGGDGVDDYSALHQAKRAEAARVGAETAETNALDSATAAATSETGASDSADAASISQAQAADSATAAAESESAAEEWANAPEDTLISAEAGGNGVDEYSAKHQALKAAEAATEAGTNKDAAATHANDAEAAKTAAEAAESAAAGYASDVAAHISDAAASADAAANSETKALQHKGAAESARDAALAALDSFDDRYLGEYSSDPITDNDGNELITGALYFNPGEGTSGVMKVYSLNGWRAAYADTSGALQASNNLADVDDAAQARTNLGLGDIATASPDDFATAAQGLKADEAHGWGDHSLAGYLTSYTVTEADVTAHQGALEIDASQVQNLTQFEPGTLAEDYGFTDNSTNWDTAYSWGNHADAGYTTQSQANADAIAFAIALG